MVQKHCVTAIGPRRADDDPDAVRETEDTRRDEGVVRPASLRTSRGPWHWLGWFLLTILCTRPTPGQGDVKDPDPRRWEPQIAAFEAADRTTPPPSKPILFIGSSSIRGWDLSRWFPERPVLNRGFGGSHISDLEFFAPRILFPYRPRVVVVYAGDNDIAAGKPPDQVFHDFVELSLMIHERLRDTRVVFISIKPSLRRWNRYPDMKQANERVEQWAARRPWVSYVDVATPMLGEDGRPRRTLFRSDGLHLNAEGYALWTKCVEAVLGPPE